MNPQPNTGDRPLAVSLIAIFQGSIACYLLYFTAAAWINPRTNLGLLRSALRLLVGRTDVRSYAQLPSADLSTRLFLFTAAALIVAVYNGISAWGLWRLKAWARHAVASLCGGEVIYWSRSFLFFGAAGGFSRVPHSALQPVYVVIFIEATIFMTLMFYGGVAQAFAEIEELPQIRIGIKIYRYRTSSFPSSGRI